MTTTTIAELQVGRPAEGVFTVRRKQRRHSRNGDPYLALELADATGTVEARVWDNAEYFDRTIKLGDAVRAAGRASRFRDALQLDVRRMQPLGDGDAVPALVPTSRRSLDELGDELDFLIDNIADPAMHGLVAAVWRGAHADALRRAPATASGHHAWLGGLVEHTVSVTTMCQAACERHAHLSESLLTAAALLHDVGRARELEFDEAIRSTTPGELVGHVLLGHEMLLAAGTQLGAPAEPWWPALLHAVSVHHGPADRCRTAEAAVLQTMNALDARITLSGPTASL